MKKIRFPALPIALIPSARVRITLTYWWRHGRLPDLDNPKTFTELVQHRKLHDHDPRMAVYSDKVHAKARVVETVGDDWTIPTLWEGRELPEKPDWPLPFIVKARHGCNQYVICHDLEHWAQVRKEVARWCERPYGLWLDEWAYRQMERGIIVEPFLGTAGVLPVDYKFYVFGGNVTYIQVHLGRANNHRWMLFDPSWRRISAPTSDADPAPPANFEKMMATAATLSDNFDFVRVDMYEIAGQPLFGEFTFYPGSGLDTFDPPSLDICIGAHWLAARNLPFACREIAEPPASAETGQVTIAGNIEVRT